MTKMLLLCALVAVAMLAHDVIRMALLFRKTIALEATAKPFERKMPGAAFHILVIGDSTALGTGATDPRYSTGGRLASIYPDAEVINLSENGLKIAGLREKLAGTELGAFDIVLIQIGANDIIRLTGAAEIRSGIRDILEKAKSYGGKTVVLHSGNIGESTFFPWYLRPLLSKRSRGTRDIYMEEAQKAGASYVDLIDSPVAALLREDPKRYYAPDMLHLSDEGYGLWAQEIEKQL